MLDEELKQLILNNQYLLRKLTADLETESANRTKLEHVSQ